MHQGEATKYWPASIDRHPKFSTFCYSLGGVLRVMSKSMAYKVGTADGLSEGLQVLGVGVSWLIYLEGMEEC